MTVQPQIIVPFTPAQPMVYTIKEFAARRLAQSVFDMEAA
jgi:hypothetical protein